MSAAVKFNTADCLINIAKQLAANTTLSSLCGRGVQVNVGGYPQKLSSEDDAPFIWVYADEDTSSTNSQEITSFVAKVVIGICPLKDIPATAALFSLRDTLAEKVAALDSIAAAIDEKLEDAGSSYYATVHPLVEELAELVETFDTTAASVTTAYESGEYETMLTNASTLVTNAASVVTGWGEVADACDGCELVEDDVEDGDEAATAVTTAKTAFNTERAAVATAYAAYIENPFVVDVLSERTDTTNGITVYGAVRTMDNIRREVLSVLRNNAFGIPVDTITFKNQSVSHYPLDWTEITINFKREETLSL